MHTKMSQIHNTGLRNADPDPEQDPEPDPNPEQDPEPDPNPDTDL